MKIAFDLKEKRPVVVHEDLTGGRYLSSSGMSQRQRAVILREYIPLDFRVAPYINEHTTNRVNEFKKLHQKLMMGKEELTVFNLVKLTTLLQAVRQEQIFREP